MKIRDIRFRVKNPTIIDKTFGEIVPMDCPLYESLDKCQRNKSCVDCTKILSKNGTPIFTGDIVEY